MSMHQYTLADIQAECARLHAAGVIQKHEDGSYSLVPYEQLSNEQLYWMVREANCDEDSLREIFHVLIGRASREQLDAAAARVLMATVKRRTA